MQRDVQLRESTEWDDNGLLNVSGAGKLEPHGVGAGRQAADEIGPDGVRDGREDRNRKHQRRFSYRLGTIDRILAISTRLVKRDAKILRYVR